MRAFVTGGTGLIGRALVGGLLDRGWEVTVLTRDATRAAAQAARGARVVVGDVTRRAFSADLAHADVVFHVAGWFEVGVRDERRMHDVNVLGTRNVLNAAREAGASRVVVTGTAGILAPEAEGRPITESSAPRDVLRDAYVVSKRQAHEMVLEEIQAGQPVTMVLPAAVFGPGDTGQLGRSLALLVRGKLNTLPSGFGRLTFVHAADVAEGHILAATAGRPGELYLLGDRVLPFLDFLRAAAEAAGVRPPSRTVPVSLVRGVARFSELAARFRGTTPLLSRSALDFSSLDVVVDASKARRDLGWSPRPFEDRIRDTMDWYVQTYGDRRTPLPVKPGDASA